jgi:hypothetical protein
MSEAEYHCQKCGAKITSIDTECPNGHNLTEVGRKINLSLSEVLTVSENLVHTSGLLIQHYENSRGNLSQIEDEIPELRPLILSMDTGFAEMTSEFNDVKEMITIVQEQQKPSWRVRIKENIVDYLITAIISFAVGLLF